jgi:tetratricopeptide (TPR) repeat protein
LPAQYRLSTVSTVSHISLHTTRICQLNFSYLLEVNAFDNALDLIEVNTLAIATMPKQSHTVEVNLKGVLASHKGQILARIGRVEEGVKYLKIAYDTLATDEPFDPCNLAWEAENSADGFATLNNFSEAVKWQEKARDLWLEYNKTEWPAMLKKHMGTALLWAGQRERAREILAEGMKQLTGTEPYYWALAAL